MPTTPSDFRCVQSPDVPPPAGHYSQAVVHGGLVFVSGLLPFTDAERRLGTIEEQTEIVLRHLERILAEAGSSLDRVIKVSVFVSDVKDWAAVNTVYARVFGEHKPARVVVPVPGLHYGAGIELEAVAAVS